MTVTSAINANNKQSDDPIIKRVLSVHFRAFFNLFAANPRRINNLVLNSGEKAKAKYIITAACHKSMRI